MQWYEITILIWNFLREIFPVISIKFSCVFCVSILFSNVYRTTDEFAAEREVKNVNLLYIFSSCKYEFNFFIFNTFMDFLWFICIVYHKYEPVFFFIYI